MLRAFLHAPSGIFAIAVLAVVAFFVAFGPALFHDAATKLDFASVSQKPSWEHPLGTDSLGRDTLARLLAATRLSVLTGLGAAALAIVSGVLFGAAAALAPLRLRSPMLRFVDAMVSFPSLLKAIAIAVIVGFGTGSLILGIGFAFAFGFARTTSTLALGVGGREFILAARVVGVRGRRLLFRHLLPNVTEPLLLLCGVSIGFSILTAAALSFLGVGVQPPEFDWGQMLTDGLHNITAVPAGAIAPAAAVALTALAFSYAGEAAARAMNPLLWTAAPRSRRTGGRAVESPSVAMPDTEQTLRETAAADPATVLDVRDLVVTFPGPTHPIEVVKGVSFSVGAGEIVGIVGESGSAKTMTALTIAQLTPYPGTVSGRVTLHGHDLAKLDARRLTKLMGKEVAFVFQDPAASFTPTLRIGEHLREGVAHRRLSRSEARHLAAAALAEVHIPAPTHVLRRYPHELSGGMRQRVMIAMGLLREPSLLICDEPTTALDVTVQAQVMDVLNEVNRTHRTAIVLISHNLALISQNCQRVLVMYAGRIVEETDAARLNTDPLHPYTRALLAAVPEIGHRGQPLTSIPGEPPEISAVPVGCPFHPRCPLVVDRCRAERPTLLSVGDDARTRVACHVAHA
jgi:oligopeptide/dipeptide ABC transporter ATP-binding protein